MALSYSSRGPTTVLAPAAGVPAPTNGIPGAQPSEKTRGRRGSRFLATALACLTLAACDAEDSMPQEEEDTEGEVEFDPEDPAQQDLEQLVEEKCLQVEQCNCGDVVFGDDDCTTARTGLWTNRLNYGRDRELTYDQQCVVSQMRTLPNMGCGSAGGEDLHLCDDFCQVFHGDQPEGAACEAYDAVVSNCAQGLTCNADFDGVVCLEAGQRVALGCLSLLLAGATAGHHDREDHHHCQARHRFLVPRISIRRTSIRSHSL